MNESKPNSGWNESKPSFPIVMNVGEAMGEIHTALETLAAMNVGEAMVYESKDKCFWAGEVHTAMETLAKEVERLRAELARCQSLLDETRTELSICQSFHAVAKREWQLEVEKVNRLEAELAAAKAASVLPVEKYEIGINHKNEVTIYMHSRNDAESAFKWLQGCMKDTPPTT